MPNFNKTDQSIPQSRGEIVSVTEFARLIGLTTRAVREMLADGMPVFERGGKGIGHKIDVGAAWHWTSEQRQRPKLGRPREQLAESDPKFRERSAGAEIKELELAKLRGEMLPIANLEMFLGDVFSEYRAAVLASEPSPEADKLQRCLSIVSRRFKAAIDNPKSITG
jgi:phage terminase Nu1 subunit (DNA packaging protein)